MGTLSDSIRAYRFAYGCPVHGSPPGPCAACDGMAHQEAVNGPPAHEEAPGHGEVATPASAGHPGGVGRLEEVVARVRSGAISTALAQGYVSTAGWLYPEGEE